jgi:hypothetical protein
MNDGSGNGRVHKFHEIYNAADYECARDGIGPVADFEWFAIDEPGHVGVFADGGTTWIPDRFFLGYARYTTLRRALANLPETGTPLFEPGAENRDPHGIVAAWASKGFFCYDWPVEESPNPSPNRPYRLVCRPSAPLASCDVDTQSRDYLELMRLQTVVFERNPSVLISRDT